MPRSCNLVVFWDNEANRTMPVVSLRDEGFDLALDAAVTEAAGVILLADCRGAEDLQRCDVALSVCEARQGRVAGGMFIVASVDSASALMQLPSLAGRSARLAGLTWNRAALCNDVGCTHESVVATHARVSVVVAARAFGLPAYDSPEMDEDAQALGFDGVCIVE